MSIVDDMIDFEWRFFDKVHNEGGRASCQDNFETFSLMRRSQFLAWDDATRAAYMSDLLDAAQRGRNPVQEKYARMMASTAPEQYAAFAHLLPALDEPERALIEEMVAIQLRWREDFARDWPQMSAQARLIHTHEDTAWGTSFETYLRGELGSYSAATRRAYRHMLDGYLSRGDNLTTETMRQTALLYGYSGLEAAEARLQETTGGGA